MGRASVWNITIGVKDAVSSVGAFLAVVEQVEARILAQIAGPGTVSEHGWMPIHAIVDSPTVTVERPVETIRPTHIRLSPPREPRGVWKDERGH